MRGASAFGLLVACAALAAKVRGLEVQAEIAHHVRRGDRDADAVQIGDGGEQDGHAQHLVADASAAGGRGS